MPKSIKCILLSLFLFISSTPLYAQQDQGAITGQVTDATGAFIPNARITATDPETGVSIGAQSNAEGLFTITGLKVGAYRVMAEASGFKRMTIDRIFVSAQSRVRVDFLMTAGDVSEAVSVTAEAPLLEKESSTLARALSEEQIKDLPVAGRNVQQLATQAAGVTPALKHTDKAGGFNANGQWATQNNFILDGVDNNSQSLGLQDQKAQVLIPSLDAVKEFKVQTSNYSAEFGRSAGAVMNLTIKSGTNQFPGIDSETRRRELPSFIKLARPTEPHSSTSRRLASGSSAFANELALKLGDPSKHRHDHFACVCRGVCPRFR